MVKVCAVPVQPFTVGVTVMVATCTVVPALVAVKLAILPLPLAKSPTEVLLLVQLKTVPVTVPLKFTAATVPLLQTAWSAGSATVGVGFTVIVKALEVPAQLLAVGVTVMVATWFVMPVLIAVKEAISPVPEAASPMEVLSLVQLKAVLATDPEKVTAVVATALHKI